MKNFTIYLVGTLCLFFAKVQAQETFEMRVRKIATNIENVTKEEKAALKIEIEAVNVQLENGTISKAQADEQKKNLAEIRAKKIETRVADYQKELSEVVQLKVDGNIKDTDTIKTRTGFTLIWNPKYMKKNDTINYRRGEARTTSQFVFAAGINNLVTDGEVANSDYRYWGSHFYEWGVTWNTRIAKDNNLLHFKYGLSVMYNNLRPTENRLFVDNGITTDLEVNPVHMKDSRFRNVNIVVPMHIEFDFSGKKEKDGKTYFNTHESFRLGIGGFAGLNFKSKQIIKYDIDGYDSRNVTKGSFNVNDFVYGLSTYIGYESTSLYLKYDLSPLFKDNAIKQNNISLGVRFDFN
ncbi:hypothetical protein FLAN108750_04445 [Flavobacterium antarcticum]|uniref:hypothetical protein n=1 Tax=Flavobacterium antarcticum TaxID=271155 RepID=UPI0003B48C6C|nr:hypothetical protein [Flavobacterium antarcticum]